MKKKILLTLFIILSILTLSACGKKQNDSIVDITPNQMVGELNYYVPVDYLYNPELRGMIYTENERKIYSSTDMNDTAEVIYIDAFVSPINVTFEEYIENVNTNNLSADDIKFNSTSNNKINVYERAGYIFVKENVERLNYAYITYKNNNIYTITLSGPRTKEESITSLAKEIFSSLSF